MSLEIDAALARFVRRLNSLTLQRALYRTLSIALLSLSLSIACAALLPARGFRAVLSVVALLIAAVAASSAIALRARWADRLAAARWVEDRVVLEQRLLTLVSAGEAGRVSRLWPALLEDNRRRLPEWRESRLGIARVPANVLLLAAALAIAVLFALPMFDGAPPATPPEAAGMAAASEAATHQTEAGGIGSGSVAVAVPAGDQPANGAQGSSGDGAGSSSALATLDALQADLKRIYARSLGHSVASQVSGREATEGAPGAGSGRDLPVNQQVRSRPEAGGKQPGPGMARREADDGTGRQVAKQDGGEGGAPVARAQHPSSNQAAAQPGQLGGAQGDRGPGGGEQRVAAKGKNAPGPGSAPSKESGTGPGGPGAGSGPATASLLAQRPITLPGAGAHQTARFHLTLGVGTRAGQTGADSKLPVESRGEIANVARGAQASERAVRHEEVPAEYESVVKRIFTREP